MGFPRSRYVQEGGEGIFHCYTRCVRRAFLCGLDKESGRDFTHRKAWLVKRLRFLTAIFAIDVCAYAVMQNHYHVILRVCPDVVARWSDLEVARRWFTLFPKLRNLARPLEEEIRALADQPDRIAVLRRRLSSLSWFMGRLNEYIAREANKEDDVKGRFWESRFKCQVLLDEAALFACMVYVDLNPIRAGVAATPEGSEFTSIRERILAWLGEKSRTVSGGEASEDGTSWLCPIGSNPEGQGILGISAAEYIELVDKSGRIVRTDKRGAIDDSLAPILMRIGVKPEAWSDTVTRFGRKFQVAAGRAKNLRAFADQIGCRWLKGVTVAQSAFMS